MPIKQSNKCVVCHWRRKRKGSLFCRYCINKDIFEKIKGYRESKEFKEGLFINKWRRGRLPRR